METLPDKRLVSRLMRTGEIERADLSARLEGLPDLAEQTTGPTTENLPELRSQLEAEREIRAERIQSYLAEDKTVQPPPVEVTPIPESEL